MHGLIKAQRTALNLSAVVFCMGIWLRRCLQTRGSLAYKREGRILARPSEPGSNLLSSSRRVFLRSLSRSALVLSLESVLALARPRWLSGNPRQNANPAKQQGADLGISFLNVARESGL